MAMDSLDLVDAWPVANVAVAVIGPTGRLDLRGDAHQVFAWASVTKLLVAVTVLVAVEEGNVELDEPAGPPGSTVRHLLAHASGLAPEGDAALTAPGRRRIYSNAGYELLAQLVSDRTGMAFTEYLGEGVTGPLGMADTAMSPGASPAWGLRGPLSDLIGFVRELRSPTLIATSTLAEAATVAFPGLPGVLPGYGRYDPCDWGLGFELRDGKRPHWTGSLATAGTFGHFGRTGSFVWVDPATGVACAALCDRDFGPWAMEAWPRLADAVVGQFTTAAERASLESSPPVAVEP
jgi:CubicO group peptidase (beta-lactamase class C family)